MKSLIVAAAITIALLPLGARAADPGHAVAATASGAPPPAITLISTDMDLYPFAAIAVNGKVFHVTDGDKFFGAYVVAIAPNKVTFSNGHVLQTRVAMRRLSGKAS